MPHKDPERAKEWRKQWERTPKRRAQERARKNRWPHTCERCGMAFTGRKTTRFCSRSCAMKHVWETGQENRFLTAGGGKYIERQVRDRRIRIHRQVMETVLGRRLRSDEFVHHVNGDKSDNRPENLTVMSPAEHARLHMKRPRTT